MKFVNPCCGYVCDASDDLEDLMQDRESRSSPRKGDLRICLNCGAVLIYLDPATNSVRLADTGDLATLSLKQTLMLAASVAHIRNRGWLKSEAQRIKGN